MHRRSVAIAGGTALIFGIAAVSVVLLLCPSEVPTVGAADRAGPDASAIAPAQEAHEVAGALQSLATDPRSLMTTATQAELTDQAATGIPPGSLISASEESWAPDGAGGGTIIVTVDPPAGSPVAYAAIMAREAGAWKVIATVPLQDDTAAPTPTEQS